MQLSSVFRRKAVRNHACAQKFRSFVPAFVWFAALFAIPASSAFAASYYVDGASSSSSDTNPGTSSSPYRTIQAAVTARGIAGNTINVRPAKYRETVTLSSAGTSSARVVLKATAAGVIITGADDFAQTNKWVQVSGDVYLASSVNWVPVQVFADGSRLTATTNAPGSMPANSFRYLAGVGLYVHAGGGNPGTHGCEVSRRNNAVIMTGAFTTLDGFTITQTQDRAVDVLAGATSSIIQNNTIVFAGKFGVVVSGVDAVTVKNNTVGDNLDHGISLTTGSTNAKAQNNSCYRNFRPAARAANGIHLNSSTNATVENNKCFENQDSGIHFSAGSHNGISRNNQSYNNGDHGYDHLGSTGIKHIHDLAYGNFKDGFSVEGNSSGCSFYNCIAVDNGITTNEYNLWVDTASSAGFVSDYNLFWNSTAQPPIRFITTTYSTVAAYSLASGNDSHSKQADPQFLQRSAGNFKLISGSPAIDAGRAGVSSWPSTDALGQSRYNDANTPNTGAGSPNYADMGALEFRLTGALPVASFTLTPTSGLTPLDVVANASASSDAEGPITAYTFDFGDGAIVGPQTVSSASHQYVTAGTFTVRVTVHDNVGQAASSTKSITIGVGDFPPAITAPATVAHETGAPLVLDLTTNDPDGPAIASFTADLSQLPVGHGATFTPNASSTAATFTWSPTPAMARTAPYLVFLAAQNVKTGRDTIAITVSNPNQFPNPALVVSPQSGSAPLTVTANASASSDPDGSIASYRFNFSDGTSVGPQASPTATKAFATGNWSVEVIVTDNKGAASISAPVAVQSLGTSANLVSNFSFETGLGGWGVYGVDTLVAVSGGQNGTQAVECRSNPTNVAMFGVNDSPNVVSNAGPAGTRYNISAWVRSASHTGTGRFRLREFNAGTQQGPTVLTTGVTLSPVWQQITMVYNTLAANSSLDLNVADNPKVAGEIFQVDNVVIQTTTTSQPIVTGPATASGNEGTTISFTVTANDPDGDAINSLTADFSSLPAGHNATFTPNASKTSGTFTWTPTFAHGRPAAYNVAFTASNLNAGTTTVPIIVTNVDAAPVVTAAPTASATETQPFTLTITAADPDDEAITSLTANLTGLPAGHDAVFTPNATKTSGTLTWTPTINDAPGPYSVSFTASNALSHTATTSIGVVEFDRAPVVSSPAFVEVLEGQPLTVTATASDPDGHAIATFAASLGALPAGNAAFTPNATNTSGDLTWTPTHADSGTYVMIFTAANAMSGADTTVIHVVNTDTPPAITAAANVTLNENALLSLDITAVDPEGEAIASLTATLTGLPAGHNAVFTPNATNTAGTLTWTPTFADSGTYTVQFDAANNLASSASTAFRVNNVDRKPVITAPAIASVGENQPLTVTVTVNDPDGDAIAAFSANLNGLPSGHNAVFTPNASNTEGTLTWTPLGGDGANSPYTVNFLASNALAATTAQTSIQVDRRPIVNAPVSTTVNENQQVSVSVTASDPNGDSITSLTANFSNLPAGHNAAFTPNATNTGGTMTWTPSFNDATAAYSLTFTASNALSGSSVTSITVFNVDRAPVAVVAGSVLPPEQAPFSLSVTAFDPDGDAINSLTPNLTGLPAGHNAVFTPNGTNTGGTMTWTPNSGDVGPYTVSFTPGNGLTGVAAQSQLTVDHHPVVAALTSTSVNENQQLSLNVVASDTDGQAINSLTADLSVLPASHDAVFTPNGTNTGGTLTWTPSYNDAPGSFDVTFTATNTLNASATTSIAVLNVDRAPAVVAPATASVTEGTLLSVAVTASDPDGDAITLLSADLDGLPGGHDAVFTPNGSNTGGTLTWTPVPAAAPGPYAITFTAANALEGEAVTSVTIDRHPVVSVLTNASATENQELTLGVVASDPDGQAVTSLTADLSGLPALHGAVFTPNGTNTGGTLTWTPNFAAAPGPYSVSFTAISGGLSSTSSSSISVANVDRAPVATAIPTALAAEGSPLSFSVTASDPDGDAITTLSANVDGLPAGHNAQFTPNGQNSSGSFTWTAAAGDGVGSPYTVTFTAANAMSHAASTAITVDRAPVVTAPASQSIDENQQISVQVTAADPDGQAIIALSANLSNLPLGHNAVFTPNATHTEGTLTWTPGYTHAPGPYSVTFTAVNVLSGSSSTSITVGNVDRAPVVTAAPTAKVAENAPLSFTITASDPDGEPISTLSADLSNFPPGHGAEFTPNATNTGGTLSWTPLPAHAPGPHSVTFTASNALNGTATTAVTVDRHPVVGAPSSVNGNENQLLTVPVTASDLDGDAITSLTADLSGLPEGHGASFTPNATNTGGTLSWTPGYTTAPGPYTVSFTATASALSSTVSTSIDVNNVDRAPIVSAPASASVVQGGQLSIVVSASDVDGDEITSLTPELSDLPAGHDAAFVPNGTNTGGTLTWTPSASDGHGPYSISFTALNAMSGSASTSVGYDRHPVVSVSATHSVNEAQQLSVSVTASDPDLDAISSLSANLSGLPGGHDAVFTPNGTNTGGTLTWTPTYSDGRVDPYSITFTATNALSGSGSTVVTVNNIDRAPVVTAQSTAFGHESSAIGFVVTASDPDGDAITSLTPDLTGLPVGHNASFTPNGSNTSGTFAWTPAVGMGRVAPYSVTFTAANALSGAASTAITVNALPLAALSVTPASGNAPLSVTANAGASSDPGGSIVSYRFDFGDGTIVGPQASATASHSYGGGTHTATVTVTDNAGATATASQQVVVSAVPSNLIANPGFETDLSGWTKVGSSTIVRVGGGHSGGFCAEVRNTGTNTCGIQDNPNVVLNVTAPNQTYRFSMWVRSAANTGSAKIKVKEYIGTTQQGSSASSPGLNLSPVWQQVTFDYVTRAAGSYLELEFNDYSVGTNEIFQIDDLVARQLGGEPDRAPVVTVAPTANVNENALLTLSVSASDADGNAITSLTANLSGLPAGHNAVFTPNGTNTGGTLTWTPTFANAPGPYTVSFTATNALTGSASTSITVQNVDRAPVVTAPATAAAQKSVAFAMSVTAADPDGQAITSLTANLTNLPAGHNAVFTPNGTNTSGTLTWTPQAADGPGPYSVTFTATNALGGTATSAIAVTNPPVVTAPAAATVNENQQVTIVVNASDPDGDAITALTANMSGLPAGHNAVFTPNAAKTQGTLTWTPTFAHGRAAAYDITFTAANAASATATTAITVTNIDRAPVVTAAATATGSEGSPISVSITAADADGEPITSLSASFANLPAGHNAVFTPNGTNTAGTLTWTPASNDGRAAAYNVTFTATNALSGTATTAITVNDVPAGGGNLVTNPGFETDLNGWVKVGSPTLVRVAGGHSGGFCAEIRNPGTGTFGMRPSPNVVTNVAAAGQTYRITMWVRSAAHVGSAKVKVKEYVGTTQQGSSAYSSGLTLSPTWQLVSYDYVTRTAGSFLEIEFNDYAIASAEIFQVDDVSVVKVTNAPAPLTQSPAMGLDGRDLAFGVRITNPVRAGGAMHFTLTQSGPARVEFFDLAGRMVSRPLDEPWMERGQHQLAILPRDGARHMSPGTYFYRLRAAEGTKVGRFVVLE